jgi:hypothetical protein
MTKVVPYIQQALDGGDLNKDQQTTFSRRLADLKESGKKQIETSYKKISDTCIRTQSMVRYNLITLNQ